MAYQGFYRIRDQSLVMEAFVDAFVTVGRHIELWGSSAKDFNELVRRVNLGSIAKPI
jgi:hypothetical protein